jgi:UPF0755 protein
LSARFAGAAIVVASLAFLIALFQPLAGDGGKNTRVVITPNSGAGRIGDLLDQEGVVKSAALFKLRAGLAGDGDRLRPGTYYLREDMSYGAVLDRLVTGPQDHIVQVTIPEGLSRVEISRIARKAGLRGDYMAASAESSLIDFGAYGLHRRPASLEGFLFPATYDVKRDAPVSSLVSKQVAAFKAMFRQIPLSHARKKNLTAFDVLTIASMVEREAQVDRERPLIAAVIYNRLHEGQPLAIDATIRYATGNWSSPLTTSQLAIRSPYNSRTHAGLPPGPIGNPGLSSIRAAADPAKVNYLYYVVKPGKCGEHSFSSSFQGFERDQARYQAARKAAGGRSPTTCP